MESPMSMAAATSCNVADALREELDHGPIGRQGAAEIARERARHPGEVLQGQRTIEAEPRANGLELLRRGIRTRDRELGAARDGVDHEPHRNRCEREHKGELRETLCEVGEHQATTPPRPAPPPNIFCSPTPNASKDATR